jgi:dihydroorotate dehydrogenase
MMGQGLMYTLLFSVALRRMPAEAAHRIGFGLIRGVCAVPGASWLLRRALSPVDPVLRVHAFGRELPGPLGLAAGFDKDAVGPDALGALGLAFVEVGTITAEPQAGNPEPRLFRLVADRALINRMGFNNGGAAAAAAHLRSRRRGRSLLVGANIGKTKVVPEAAAAADYAASARLLAPFADYLVLNVSSPNTPGLRNLQAADHLRPLIAAVRRAVHDAERGPGQAPDGRPLPLLIKIAPDLADEDIDTIADLALELALDGIIATNTTVSRDNLASSRAEVAAAGPGGLSGAPLRPRAVHVLRRLRARVGDRLVLVASGGIESPEDAWERIEAGATLLQAYTGFVYGGPLWPRRIHRGLARRARGAGLASIQQAVGTAAASTART